MQASKQGRRGLQAKAAAKRALVATTFWSLQGGQLFVVFLDNFTQDGDVDWPRCEKFVEEVNKVPELVLKCWSQDGNCDACWFSTRH